MAGRGEEVEGEGRRIGVGRGRVEGGGGAAIKPNCGRVDCDSLLHCPPPNQLHLYFSVFTTAFLYLYTWTCSTAVFVTTVVGLRL